MPAWDHEALRRLPRRKEVWQGGLVRLPFWVTEEGKEPIRPWGGAWVSLGSGKIHIGQAVGPAERDSRQALDAFAEFALDGTRAGYIPERVEVTGPGVMEALENALGPLGVTVNRRDRLAGLDDLLRDLGEKQGTAAALPGVLHAPGMSVERVAAFAEAARLFFLAAPWRYLTDQDRIRLEEPTPRPGFQNLLVMGAGGRQFGLMLFETPGFHEAILASDDPETLFKGDAYASVFFGPIHEMPLQDADIFEDHRLPVAGPRAYPWAARLKGRRVGRLSPRDLVQVEVILRALAAATEPEIDSGRWTRILPSADGPVKVTLALPDLLEEDRGPGRARPPLLDRRAGERLSAELHRYFRDHPAKSVKEMNRVMERRFSGRKLDDIPSTASTPLEKAQELCYRAFDVRGRRRILLAREALRLSADCADAYVILAEQSGDPEAELRLWQDGVAAGERALGPARLQRTGDRFWGDITTRPYMRALEGLAHTCRERGQLQDAIVHFQKILLLNPEDNQGVRFPLAGLLLRVDDHAALGALLDQFEEDETMLLYPRALRDFRLHGDTPATRKTLRRALRANRYVPALLLGREEVPPWPPDAYSPGGQDEAALCALELTEPWKSTPDAIEWLRRQTK